MGIRTEAITVITIIIIITVAPGDNKNDNNYNKYYFTWASGWPNNTPILKNTFKSLKKKRSCLQLIYM